MMKAYAAMAIQVRLIAGGHSNDVGGRHSGTAQQLPGSGRDPCSPQTLDFYTAPHTE